MSSQIRTPAFGDTVENGWASEANPTRTGFFVREFWKSGRMNGGRTWEITDGKGKFWTFKPTDIAEENRLTVTPAALSEGKSATEGEALKVVDEMVGLLAPDQGEMLTAEGRRLFGLASRAQTLLRAASPTGEDR